MLQVECTQAQLNNFQETAKKQQLCDTGATAVAETAMSSKNVVASFPIVHPSLLNPSFTEVYGNMKTENQETLKTTGTSV